MSHRPNWTHRFNPEHEFDCRKGNEKLNSFFNSFTDKIEAMEDINPKKEEKDKEMQVNLFGEKVKFSKNLVLSDYFVVPPFSLLDTRQGYWINRRNKWLKFTGNLEESRENTLFGGGNQKESFVGDKMINIGSTSHFDPVLAEIIFKWFNYPNGKILDPFGGEQTKGVVAGVLGYDYVGVEYRQEQVDVNNKACEQYGNVHYVCGDSADLDLLVPEKDFDLVFTSPPYYDLEIYSAKDSSAMQSYEEFMQFYKKVFHHCYDKLKQNRFLVLKLAEIRNKKTGEYRNFIGDNIRIMQEIGFKYYNEIILINAVGTVHLRSKKIFQGSRKVGKVHQNILVFYKGNTQGINQVFGGVEKDETFKN